MRLTVTSVLRISYTAEVTLNSFDLGVCGLHTENRAMDPCGLFQVDANNITIYVTPLRRPHESMEIGSKLQNFSCIIPKYELDIQYNTACTAPCIACFDSVETWDGRRQRIRIDGTEV